MLTGVLLCWFVCVALGAIVPHEADGGRRVGDISAKYAAFHGREAKRAWPKIRVAVGWNACLDVIVSAQDLLQEAHLDALTPVAKDYETIPSPQAFVDSFAHFSGQGKAAERFVVNETFFEELSNAAVSRGRLAVGGNAALVAMNIAASPSVDVLLGGIVRERLRPLLPKSLAIIGPTEAKVDQIHIIAEYAVGSTLFGKTVDRANRFIVSADVANAKLEPAVPFLQRLLTWKPDAVFLSGLHMLDGVAERSERRHLLRAVRDALRKFRNHVPVHFEFASIGSESLVSDVIAFIKDDVESIGFNEVETQSVYFAVVPKQQQKLKASSFSHAPSILDVEEAMTAILDNLPNTVSRLHFHSLGVHVIATRGSQWQAENAAVLTGSVVTSMRVCNVSSLDTDAFSLIVPTTFTTRGGTELQFNPHANWTRQDKHFSAAPVLVCKKPVYTVGAGDSISANGFLRSLRNWKNKK